MKYNSHLVFTGLSVLLLVLLSTLCVAESEPSTDPCDLKDYCTPEEAFECVKKANFESDYYKGIIDDLVALIEPYVFLEILKNPPQPNGFSNYIKAVDLIGELRNVSTSPASYYDFFRTVQRVLNSARDGHFAFVFLGNDAYENKVITLYSFLPLQLYAIDNNGAAEMRSRPINATFYEHFANGDEIRKIVERNVNVSIKTINGISPFEFVLNFGNEYYNHLKNRDAMYTYATYMFRSNYFPLYYFPLTLSDYKNISFIYANGDTITTDFAFHYRNITAKDIDVYVDGRRRRRVAFDPKDFSEYLKERTLESPLGKPVDYAGIINDYESGNAAAVKHKKPLSEWEAVEQLKKIDLRNITAKILKKRRRRRPVRNEASGEVEWDYMTTDSILKCKADDVNKANTIVLTSFVPDDISNFLEVLLSCAVMFDGNDYPLFVITDNNGGGLVLLTSLFIEVVQPDWNAQIMVAYKDNPKDRNAIDMGYYADLSTIDTCSSMSSTNDLYTQVETDYFGEGASLRRSRVHLMAQSVKNAITEETRKLVKNRKKPTEIVVFTDSFSFSASSILTKGLREGGGAIIAGYNGYPGSKKETFDIGQSPTNCLQDGLEKLDPNAYKRLTDKGVLYLSMSFGAIYKAEDVFRHIANENISNSSGGGINNDTLVPREFLFDPADERLPIYGAYDDTRYELFVEAGKGVVEKYKTQCNPANPLLHMRSSECDAAMDKPHMHGGFACGADGRWSTKCEGYYCDDGFYFNPVAMSCVEDLCKIDLTGLALGVIIVLAFVGVIVLLLMMGGTVATVICVKKKKPSNRYNKVNEEMVKCVLPDNELL